MYETFYQLRADPFRLSPDPAFSFQHRTYRKALTYMLHALRRAEGFVMITGQPGTGKTTLVSDLVSTLSSDQVAVAKIVSTQLSSNDLLNMVAYSFNLDPEGWSKAKVLVQLQRYLKQQYQQGRRPLLIVDEAQGMDKDALEEIRLLTNMLVINQQLLQIFLVGQEQLLDTVNTPSLVQLQQRLVATTFLEPLDTDDTEAYIKHRLRHVNWRGDPLISTETYAMIQRYSHGIPRRINQLCSRLFLHGSIEEKHRLGTADLEVVVEELQQELLLPMDKVTSFDAAPWPVEHYEETYEEELQTGPLAPQTILPTTEFQPETDRSAQPSSTRVAETRPRMAAREAAPALSQDNQAGDAATPVPVKEFSVADPLTREEIIAQLLANGQRSLQRDRLLTPKDDSAYYYFQQVLELDPGNSQVHDGMEQIVARYAALVTAALDKNDWNKAGQYIARGCRISRNNEDLQALHEQNNAPVKIAPEPEPEDIFL